MGLKIAYLGMTESGNFRLKVTIESLDHSTAYPIDLNLKEVKLGFMIVGHHFNMEKITPLYIHLRSEDKSR
jgi:hypothetical protein